MFEIGKKGTDKGQNTMARDDHASTSTAFAQTTRRPTGPREAAVIGPSIRIDGDLRGEEDLLIEGEVKGTVQLKENNLVIGPQGRIRATVYAHSIVIEGQMEGDLYGADCISIRKDANVKGNITAPRVSIDDGARFKGSIEMDAQAVEAALGKSRAAAAPASLGAAGKSTASLVPADTGLAGKPESVAAAK